MPHYSEMPENAVKQFKCAQCGTMFSIDAHAGNCPSCNYHCSIDNCRVVDASDEGY